MIVLDKLKTYNYFFKAQLMLGFLLCFNGCDQQKHISLITGETMGTTYSIKIAQNMNETTIQPLQNGIDSVLHQINKQMSTWDPKSEISMFNQWQSIKPYPVSFPIITVIDTAILISKKTQGLFDFTVYDLMSLWGFGPNPKIGMPSISEVDRGLSSTGYSKIKIINNTLKKNHPLVKIDLNAIAKGYAVDQVFKYIQDKGFNNIFVEIGGEVRSSGRNSQNDYWSIGIENPYGGEKSDKQIAAIVDLDNNSVATSGNYRNIVNINGDILGHTINPRTGYPIQTNILSVTVITRSSMIADGWATALMTMDYKEGLEIINKEDGLEAIWIILSKDGTRSMGLSAGAIMREPIYDIK